MFLPLPMAKIALCVTHSPNFQVSHSQKLTTMTRHLCLSSYYSWIPQCVRAIPFVNSSYADHSLSRFPGVSLFSEIYQG